MGFCMSADQTILNAAERVFAAYGYEGASMRKIAEQANVAQGLLHYHFKNKDNLYAAVFARRSSAINKRRSDLLDQLFATATKPKLEQVLEILLFPAEPEPGEDPRDYNMFQQIVSASTVATDERSKTLMALNYDPIALRFVESFTAVLPEISRENAIWAYLFALGARMQASAPNDRAKRLIGSGPGEPSRAVDVIIPFVAAGIRAISGTSKSNKR